MHIYLAGPMTGYPHDNVEAFDEAAKQLRAKGHIVFNPPEHTPTGDIDRRRCLAVDLAWICCVADELAMLPGWELSRGATAEHAVALALGLHITYL